VQTKTTDSPSADHEMDNAYQNEFTEESMPDPAQRDDTAKDLQMDPVAPGNEQAGIPTSMPKAGGEPDFDDEVAAEEDDDDDDDDEGEDTTA